MMFDNPVTKILTGLAVVITIIICDIFVFIFVFYLPLMSTGMDILSIEQSLEPVDPYDIADLEEIVDMNTSRWEIIVRLVDVESNETVYETGFYDVDSGSFYGFNYVKG